MRLLLVAAGVAVAVRRAVGDCTQPATYPAGHPQGIDLGTEKSNLADSDAFHADFDIGNKCLTGYTGIPVAAKCSPDNNPFGVSGCSDLKDTLKKVDTISKKCSNTKKQEVTSKPATAAACWTACYDKIKSGTDTTIKAVKMAIAFKANNICDCYPAISTYGKACEKCDGTAYDGVDYYVPEEAGYCSLPKSCAAVSTDDEDEKNAASLPLAGATVVAAGIASLYA